MRGKLKGRDWAHQQAMSTAWHTALWSSFSKTLPPLRKAMGLQPQAARPMSQDQLTANLRKWAIRLGGKA